MKPTLPVVAVIMIWTVPALACAQNGCEEQPRPVLISSIGG